MKFFSLLFILVIASSCKAQTFNDTYFWLLGKWEMKEGASAIIEAWTFKDDSTFVGISSIQNNQKEQKILETMELRKRGGFVYYVPTVSGQNNNQEVVFIISLLQKNKFTAENQEHDFPKKISYELISAAKLLARIEGTKDGKTRKEEWLFKKLAKK